jgi:hypothetical protein
LPAVSYTILFTSDGLAVTNARFMIRNSRKQFPRVEPPAGSTVWSAFVDGRPERPALGEERSASGPKCEKCVTIP